MKSYLDEYKRKLITAKQAAQLVKSGDSVEYAGFCAKPVDFDLALAERFGEAELSSVQVRGTATVLPIPEVIKVDPQQKVFQYRSWYYTAIDRILGDRGMCTYSPINYHEASELFYNEEYVRFWPDIWCSQVAPMDEHGYFNFGLANSYNRAQALGAKISVVEVNRNMPRCLGGIEEGVHISEIDYVMEGSNSPIFTLPGNIEASPSEKAIAQLIVDDIRDGDCLQLGIGSLPNVIGHLVADSDLKDLGIQSELFCDACVEMYETNKITNAKKRMDRFKTVYTFAFVSHNTLAFMDQNPLLASCPSGYTNDPERIALNDNVVSINNILELDLLGQVCSESKGLRQISGTGGQLDWVIGASKSRGGRSFLAFNSTYTDKAGNLHSRINPLLTPGAVVTVPRSMVHYLVTEYGKVSLKALSIWDRAEAIISIAHPQFRDELIKQAAGMKIWKPSNKIQ